jgi:serine protease AprX
MKFFATTTLLLVGAMAQAGSLLHFHNGSINPKAQAQSNLAFDHVSQDYVLQFKGMVTEADKQELQAQGMQVFRYMPDDALIVRATAQQLSSYATNGKVNAFVLYKGAMKLSSNLPSLSVFSQNKFVNVNITTFQAQDTARILASLQSMDARLKVIDQSAKSLAVQVQQTLLPTLAEMPGVEFIQELVKLEPLHMTLEDAQNDEIPTAGDYTDITGFETGTKVMNMDAIWAQGYKGNGQVVGVADTGLDTGVAETIAGDFAGTIVKGFAFGIGSNGNWGDPMGHGTHVAGSVLGRGTPSGGLLKGAAFEANLVPEGMWSPIINNLTVPQRLSTLFQSAYDNGARIHTNSWGAAREDLFGSYEAMAQQVDQYMWDHPDMLIIYAAGNSGVDKNRDGRIDPNSVGPPGTSKNTLTVGASENLVSVGGIQKPVKELRDAATKWGVEPIFSSKVSDNIDGVAMFSSRGPLRDGRLKPEIVAPGTNILSARSHTPTAELLWGEYNKDYVYSGGTSMATPLTAGAAAITREVLIKKYAIANPSAALVKATLLHTAKDMFPGQYGGGATQEFQTHRPNNDEGYGRVDMAQLAGLTDATHFVEAEVAQGADHVVTAQVSANGKLLVNLVYTDAPGATAAAVALVNDLDLEVKAIGANGESDQVVSLAKDALNNNEIVELSGLTAGMYQISVKGTKIPMGRNGKQPFALVYTAL